MTRVGVLDSGVANIASMVAALRRLDLDVEVIRDPEQASEASHLVLPGVGHFAEGRAALAATGLDRLIVEAVAEGRPLLAVCLGLQLLCEGSEESPETAGLGVIPGRCVALPPGVLSPHLGWNGVFAESSCRYLTSGTRAFANSFVLKSAPEGWSVARSRHGAHFVSALERGRLLACQFHPELSGAAGQELLRAWVNDRPAECGEEPMASLSRRILSCLDVRDGRVVKGIRFGSLRDRGDPAERAALYQEQGADEIVVLDVAASARDEGHRLQTTVKVRSVLGIPLTVGGGVRGVEDGRRLLAAGADKIGVNTAAVKRPALLTELATAFGSQCAVLAVDARRKGEGWEVLVRGGRESVDRDVVAWCREGVARGAGEILLTSWDRDGTGIGCDTELLTAVSSQVNVPVIASGGVGSESHVGDALRAGADAVLAATIFHEDQRSVADLKKHLAEEGFEVRR